MSYSNYNQAYKSFIHSLYSKKKEVNYWFRSQFSSTPPPVYASFDLRCSPFKLSVVDANFFPSGFSNISQAGIARFSRVSAATIKGISPKIKNIFLLAENFSRNSNYRDNVLALRGALSASGYTVSVGITESVASDAPQGMGSQFRRVSIDSGCTLENQDGIRADLIIANRDFSTGVPEEIKKLSVPIHPHPSHGWYVRRKSTHSTIQEEVANQFADTFTIKDIWHIVPMYRNCHEIDYLSRSGMECIKNHAETLLTAIEEKYLQYHIDRAPYTVVKPDAGTFGLGIHVVRVPSEVEKLNRKQRTKLSATKEIKNRKVIIQEGVPSHERNADGLVSETVLYFADTTLVDSFSRVGTGLGEEDNLNRPGSHFENHTDISDFDTVPHLYAMKVAAQISLLAMAKEPELAI